MANARKKSRSISDVPHGLPDFGQRGSLAGGGEISIFGSSVSDTSLV
jgi:hypothetical protein